MRHARYFLPLVVLLAAACEPEDYFTRAYEPGYIGLPTSQRTGSQTPVSDSGNKTNLPPGSGGSGSTPKPIASATPSSGSSSPSSSPTPDPSKMAGAGGIYVDFTYPNQPLIGVQAEMKITDAPDPSPTAGVIFWSHQFNLQNHGGYIGLQIVGDKRKAIFSMWEALSSDTGNTFGGEGVGFQKIIDYDWRPNMTYQVNVTRTKTDSTGAYWRGSVTDLTTGAETYLATHKVPLTHGTIRNASVWTEYATHRYCEVPYTRAEFSNPKALSDNTWLPASSAKGTYLFNVYSSCPLSNFIKLPGPAAALEVGVGVERVTPENTRLW